jgi:hypothetical protein
LRASRSLRVGTAALWVGLCATVSASAATAQSDAVPPDTNDALKQANHPVPTTLQLAFEPQYTFRNGDSRYVAQLLFQPTMPYDGFFLPGLEVPGFRSVASAQIYAQSQQIGSDSASGLTDLQFTDGIVRTVGPLELGAGFTTYFPMATNPALGQGKWQIGPAAVVYLELMPQVSIGSFVHVLWSVAGDSNQPTLGYAIVEPLLEVRLPGRISIFSNQQMNFYWEGGSTTVPVNLGVGHDFDGHFVGQLQGAYTLSGQGQGSVEAIVVLNFQ